MGIGGFIFTFCESPPADPSCVELAQNCCSLWPALQRCPIPCWSSLGAFTDREFLLSHTTPGSPKGLGRFAPRPWTDLPGNCGNGGAWERKRFPSLKGAKFEGCGVLLGACSLFPFLPLHPAAPSLSFGEAKHTPAVPRDLSNPLSCKLPKKSQWNKSPELSLPPSPSPSPSLHGDPKGVPLGNNLGWLPALLGDSRNVL